MFMKISIEKFNYSLLLNIVGLFVGNFSRFVGYKITEIIKNEVNKHIKSDDEKVELPESIEIDVDLKILSGLFYGFKEISETCSAADITTLKQLANIFKFGPRFETHIKNQINKLPEMKIEK